MEAQRVERGVSGRSRARRVLAIGALVTVAVGITQLAESDDVAAVTVASGRVDATNATASRWTSRTWTPTRTAHTTLRLSWPGTAMLHVEIRIAATRQWIAANTTAVQPKTVAFAAQAGTPYRIAVWAETGAADFTVDDVTVSPPQTRPNILLIISDDQRRDSIAALPNIRRWMADGGTTYTQGYVTTPSCCPSRAAILTGRYDHNNGVTSQKGPAFDEATSFARYLDGAGYHTGHIGKYVHYYSLSARAPYWDRWTYWKGGYDNAVMNFDGVVRTSSGYSTTIAFDTAIGYVRDWEGSDATPWMMQIAPTAPHRQNNGPPPAEPKFASATVPPWIYDPSTFEADRSDKPSFLYCCSVTPQEMSTTRTAMVRAMYSIDDGVNRLLTELAAKGELENTLVIYTSDNGWLFGDHGLHEKFVPYHNSVGVPLLVRWPGRVAAGVTDARFAANIDLAPTMLAAAGIVPTTAMDGRDLLSSSLRPRRLTEYWQDSGNIAAIPDWASLTTTTYQYTEYYEADHVTVRFREYYALTSDPYQLVNLFGDGNPANDPDVSTISAQLRADRTCRTTMCP